MKLFISYGLHFFQYLVQKWIQDVLIIYLCELKLKVLQLWLLLNWMNSKNTFQYWDSGSTLSLCPKKQRQRELLVKITVGFILPNCSCLKCRFLQMNLSPCLVHFFFFCIGKERWKTNNNQPFELKWIEQILEVYFGWDDLCP